MSTDLDQPCPCCHTATGVRWLDSSLGADSWGCAECGHEWTILVDEPVTAAVPDRTR